jgi:precorrin-8X/cobalt-precorrin-8 methylmutase
MEWNITKAKILASIDEKATSCSLTPAEYEITRQVIYETGDIEYLSLIDFADRALQNGSAAIATRTKIIVDIPMVQAGINQHVRQTFANPLYCATEAIARPQLGRTQADWGIRTLAERYPDAIFLIGHSQDALNSLTELITVQQIRPAFIVATVVSLTEEAHSTKQQLKNTGIPYICLHGNKGGPGVAVAIFKSLLNLTWLAYGSQGVN